jgi:hypothetical protein
VTELFDVGHMEILGQYSAAFGDSGTPVRSLYLVNKDDDAPSAFSGWRRRTARSVDHEVRAALRGHLDRELEREEREAIRQEG